MISAISLLSEVISKLTLTPRSETDDKVSGKRKIAPPAQKNDQTSLNESESKPLRWIRDEEGEIILLSDPNKEIITI